MHKKHNLVDHLPDEHKADVKKKLQNAYAMVDYTEAKRALERLHRELMELNPSAARSLEEGMVQSGLLFAAVIGMLGLLSEAKVPIKEKKTVPTASQPVVKPAPATATARAAHEVKA